MGRVITHIFRKVETFLNSEAGFHNLVSEYKFQAERIAPLYGSDSQTLETIVQQREEARRTSWRVLLLCKRVFYRFTLKRPDYDNASTGRAFQAAWDVRLPRRL